MLTERQISELRRLLERRLIEVRESIRPLLLETDDENYLQPAGRVSDLENASPADPLSDVSLAGVDRLLEEARDIDTALLRIAHGSFGRCMDCGEDIVPARLQAYPEAKRCLSCQSRYERHQRALRVRSSV